MKAIESNKAYPVRDVLGRKCAKCTKVYHGVPREAHIVGLLAWWKCEDCGNAMTNMTDEMKRALGIRPKRSASHG